MVIKTTLIWFANHSIPKATENRKPTEEEEKNGSSTQTAGDEKGEKTREERSILGFGMKEMRVLSSLFIGRISGSKPAV